VEVEEMEGGGREEAREIETETGTAERGRNSVS
jgi:hypothetical protein